METINKENLESFLKKYKSLNDGKIESIFYDIKESQIEVIINIAWKEESKKKKDETINITNKKIKLIFKNIEECNNKEIYDYDFIYEAYIKYIKIKEKEYICFASDKTDPFIYIVSAEMYYEKM